MRPRSGVYVNGPYPHRRRWRVRVHRGGGSATRSFATYEAALRFRAEVERQTAERTVSDAIEAFADHQRRDGTRESSVMTTRARLRSLFGVGPLQLGGLLGSITPARARSLYRAWCERPTRTGRPPAPDTRLNTLAEAGTFARWCVGEQWLRSDPFAGVTDKVRRRRGKPQLRVDEARALTDLCLERGAEDPGAIAALTALLLGLRAGEVAGCQVRDVDDDGRVLEVADAKTPSGKRRVELPDVLQPLLASRAQGRPALAPLFLGARGTPATRHWVAYHVERIRHLASLPRVTAHGLRGTHQTLARAAGVSAHAVAASVGHASTSVQEQHYLDVEGVEAARRSQALRVIRGGRSSR